jgi:hypothetical protein
LICIQGDWSNVVDAKIKGRLATALGVDSRSPFSPLYARAVGTPKPWGVTALFAEYTGTHPPLEVDWTLERGVRTTAITSRPVSELVTVAQSPVVIEDSIEPEEEMEPALVESSPAPAFPTFWEFAIAVNRSDPAALALASDGATSDIPIDGAEMRKLVTMMWFRTVLTRLSGNWRDRLLSALIEHVPVSDHIVKHGRHFMHLRELSYAQLQEVAAKTLVPDSVRPDLDLLITVGRFWGPDALKRFRFIEVPNQDPPSKVESLLGRFLS